MRGVTAILALALLCIVTDARLTWQHGSVLRGLLQVTPAETTVAAAPVQMAPQGGSITPTAAAPEAATRIQQSVQEQGPAAAVVPATQPAGAITAAPTTQTVAATTATADPAATAAAEPAAAATTEPAATATAEPVAATTTAPATTAPAATATATTAAEPAVATAAPADATAAATATSEPKVLRPGVYVIEDPPPPAPVTATATPNATANATAGPALPAAGKNLMVVMTVLGEQARVIYNNQQSLKKQLADAAGVEASQVYFYNQTANMDPNTGQTAMSLIMNVDCTTQEECVRAGMTLYNTSSQTRLTDGLAKSSISLLPGTFQVYGVNSVGRYKGNDTLYENKALTAPKAATTALDYNATMARFNQPLATAGARANATGAAASMPLGNYSIPGFTLENTSLPTQPSLAGLNLTSFGNLSLPGALPGDIANTAEPAAPATTARSSAATSTAAFSSLLVAAAAAAAVLL